MRAPSVLGLTLSLVAALAGVSCQDPVHEQAVDALGPEQKGVEKGEKHRPGQPCLTCHGGSGPGEPDFSVAGTVFTSGEGTTPSRGVRVTITDHAGQSRAVTTNSAGNFFIEEKKWEPVFPLTVRLEKGGREAVMRTRIGGSGGCGSCHRDARRGGPDSAHVSAVYLEEGP